MSVSDSLCGCISSDNNIKWEIKKAYFVDKQVGEFLTSPPFDAHNAKWQVKIFPRGINEKFINRTSIIMQLLYSEKPIQTKICMSLSENIGDDENLLGAIHLGSFSSLYTTDSPWQTNASYEYDTLMAKYTDGDETAKFTIWFSFISKNKVSTSELFSFSNALNNQDYSDVKFTVQGKSIYAHKIVVANKSKVFAAMFKHQMKENLDGEVEIKDVEYEVMLELLRYIYSGSVNDIEKMAKPLLIAAEKYDLIDLKTHCAVYLGKKVTVDNVKECLDLAECCNVQLLKQKATDFVKQNADEIVEMPVFKLIMESHPDIVLDVVRSLSAKRPRLV